MPKDGVHAVLVFVMFSMGATSFGASGAVLPGT
jgi:hypothetical protein